MHRVADDKTQRISRKFRRQRFHVVMEAEPEIWRQFPVGGFVDVLTVKTRRGGPWNEVEIIGHKLKGKSMKLSSDTKALNYNDRNRMKGMGPMEAILVHCIKEQRRNSPFSYERQWIAIDRNSTICDCSRKCKFDITGHGVAAPGTRTLCPMISVSKKAPKRKRRGRR